MVGKTRSDSGGQGKRLVKLESKCLLVGGALLHPCQSIDHHLSNARSAPTLLHEQSLLSHAVSDAQLVDLLSGA